MNKLRILLADDSRFFRTIEAKFLQNTPAEIIEASTTHQTLEMVQEMRPDLIYMSVNLIPSGGIDCCRTIKQNRSWGKPPVVMICDQQNAEEQTAGAYEAGADGVLIKPLNRQQFLDIGRQYLTGIREHRQPSFFSLSFSFNGDVYSGKCLDISNGGLFLETKENIPAGTLVHLDMKLPGTTNTHVKCQTEVMWANCRPNPMKPHYPQGYGLKFVALTTEIHTAIAKVAKGR